MARTLSTSPAAVAARARRAAKASAAPASAPAVESSTAPDAAQVAQAAIAKAASKPAELTLPAGYELYTHPKTKAVFASYLAGKTRHVIPRQESYPAELTPIECCLRDVAEFLRRGTDPKAPGATPTSEVAAPAVGSGLAAVKKSVTAPSKPVVTDASGNVKPASKPAPRPHGKFAPLVVSKVTDFNGATQAQLEAWYEAATGKDSTKVTDLLGACVAAFRKGKTADAATQKKAGSAPLASVAAQLKTPAPKAEPKPKAPKVTAPGPTGRPRGLLSAPPADMALKVAEDTSRIRAGFTLEMLQAAQALVKKQGSFTRAELFAKFPGQSNSKLTDAFYCGTERGIYVPAK